MAFSDDEEDQDTDQPQTPSKSYEGEDTSPTTERELKGWYAYPIAAEVFAVVAVGAFLPVLLEQLARENGHFFSSVTPCISPSNSTSENTGRADDGKKDTEQCMVKYLGREMSTSSFAMYTSSTAVLMQAVVLILFSSFADHGPYRKRMLTLTSYTGALSSTLFIFISPRVYYLAPLLTIIGVASLGCSFVLLNAFLPLLVANHPGNDYTSKPLAHPDDFELDEPTDSFELEALNPTASVKTSDADRLSGDLALSAKISSKGVGYGYISAVGVEILAIFIIYGFSKTSLSKSNPSLSIRVILLLVGLWWAIFTIPTLLWLRPRPGPPLPSQTKLAGKNSSKLSTFIFYTAFSLRSFWGTLRLAVALRQTLIFLLSWFLLSDAVATISGTAVLFARTELHMSTIPIALLSITSIGSGILGAFAWPLVQARYSLAPKTILLLCVAGMEIIPLYGLLGYVPHSPIGLLHVWEIYPVAVVHGVVMGGISSYARSVFSPLIPEGKEAAFFALYAVTDKGSSAVGPALVGYIVDHAGSIRPAFMFLAVLCVLPAPLLWALNVEKGREDAKAMAEGEGRGWGRYERVGVE